MEVTAHFSPLTNIAILLMAASNLLLLVGVVYFAWRLKAIVKETVKNTLDETLPRVQPVIDNVTQVTAQVNDLVQKVGPRIDRITEEAESTVHNVAGKFKTTSTIVTENVARPVVAFASTLAAIQKGMAVMRRTKSRSDESTDPSS